MIDEDTGLELGVGFDTSGAEKAVEKIGKKIAFWEKELANVQKELERNEATQERIAKIMNDGTDGIRSGAALIELQNKHLVETANRWEELKNKEKECVSVLKELRQEYEKTQQTSTDKQFVQSDDVERSAKAQEQLNAELARSRQIRQEQVAANRKIAEDMLNQANSEERVAESAKRAEAEFSKIGDEVRNLTVGEGMDFQSVNGRLEQMKEAVQRYRAEEERLTQTLEQQNAAIVAKKSTLEDLLNGGASTEQVTAKAQAVASLEEEAEKTRLRLDAVKTAIYDIQQKYQELAQYPMRVDLEGADKAKDDAKQLESALKNIKVEAEEIKFPQLSIDVDDSKLKSLISKYNQLASQYDTQSLKVAQLRAQVEELHREEARQSSKGVVSSQVTSLLAEYSRKLSEAEAKMDSLAVKTQNAQDAVSNYSAELAQSGNVATSAFSGVQAGLARIGEAFSKVITRIKNMIFRFVVMRTLYAAFNSLKKVMSSIVSENSNLQNSFNKLKSTALVAFYPIIEKLSMALEKLVNWLIKATSYVGAFIHGFLGADMNNSVKQAEKLYNAMNADKTAKAEEKAIDRKIKAKQDEIKALDKQAKAIKKEYEEEKKAINRKKDALDDEIKAVNRTIESLRKQEAAEKKLAQEMKKAIQEQIDALNARKKAREAEINAQKKAIDDEIKAVDREKKVLQDQIKELRKQQDAREEAVKGEEKALASFDTLQILQTSEAEDEEVRAIENQISAIEDQIDALEEKREILQETKDEIPTGSDDPLIAQIEAEIEALNKQKEAIKEVDYSPLIEQQQSIIQGYQDQKEALDEVLEKLQDKYDFKIEGIDEAKQKIQEAIQRLQEEKAEIASVRDEVNKPFTPVIEPPPKDKVKKVIDTIGVISLAFGGLLTVIGAVTGNIPLLLSGIGLMLGGVVTLIANHLKELKEKFDKNPAFQKIKGKFKELKDKFKEASEAFQIMVDTFVKEWNKPESDRSGFVGALHAMFDAGGFLLSEFVQKVVDFGIDVLEAFTTLAEVLTAVFEGDYTTAWEKFYSIPKGIFDKFVDALAVCAENVALLVSAIIGLFNPFGGMKKFFEWRDKIDNWAQERKAEGIIPDWALTIPALAKGAVLPGGKPFVAMLGDQPAGQTNIETPEKLLRQIVRDELNSLELTPNVDIHFDGNLSQLARIMQPYIEVANKRASAFA